MFGRAGEIFEVFFTTKLTFNRAIFCLISSRGSEILLNLRLLRMWPLLGGENLRLFAPSLFTMYFLKQIEKLFNFVNRKMNLLKLALKELVLRMPHLQQLDALRENKQEMAHTFVILYCNSLVESSS